MEYLNYKKIKAFNELLSVLESSPYISHDKITKDLDNYYAQMLDELGEADSRECVDSFCNMVSERINQRGTMLFLRRDGISEALSAWKTSKGSGESLITDTITTACSAGQDIESQLSENEATSLLHKKFFWEVDELKAFLNKCEKEHTLAEVAEFYYSSNGKKLYRNKEGKELLMRLLIRLNILSPTTEYDTFRRVFKD